MKNSEIAEGAIEVLETKGWVRGRFHSPGKGFCLVGAGLSAMGVSNYELDIWANWPLDLMNTADLEAKVSTVFSPKLRGKHPIAFNDQLATSKEDVLDLLTETAKFWRDKGE